MEDPAFNVVSFERSSDNVVSTTLSVDPKGNRSAQTLLKAYGDFENQWSFSEVINSITQKDAPTPFQIVALWASDCYNKNRAVLLSSATQVGCSTVRKGEKSAQTCILGSNYFSRDLSVAVLNNARVQKGPFGLKPVYKNAADFTKVAKHPATDFVNTVAHQGKDPEVAQKAPVEMGTTLKTDGSVLCPDYINSNLQKAGSKVNGQWILVEGACKRNTGEFAKSKLHGEAAFAKSGRCFQRTEWCSEEGKVYASHREYVTYAVAYKVGAKQNILATATDHSTRCPEYVNQ